VSPPDEQTRPAGDLGAWVRAMHAALRGDRDAEVRCGGCTACCQASQFVAIEPDETDSLAHIPRELLFPAPRRPRGHVLLGYDERGRCPMLGDGGCTIYAHRPRACRTYDCRIFPATGVEPDPASPVSGPARSWRFDPAGPESPAGSAAAQQALRAAAAFLVEHPEALPGPGGAPNPTAHAVLAVEAHEAFLQRDPGANGAALHRPTVEEVRVTLGSSRRRAARRLRRVDVEST
jgi:Fe-S-cluster containining protein